MDIQDELGGRLRTAALVAAGVIGSLLLYLGLAEVVRAVRRPFLGFAAVADVQQLRFAVFGGAAAAVVIIRILRPLLLRMRPGDDDKAALLKLQRAAIVTLVLGEVPGILGLGLFLLTGHNIDFYVLLFASLLLAFMYFPRRAAWEEWLRDRP